MFRKLLDTGLPTLCAVCRSWSTQSVCEACQQDHGQPLMRCPGCALPLAPGLVQCHDCATETRPSPSACIARVAYEWPWTQVMASFKFHGQSAWGRDMARLMLEQPGANDMLSASDLLIPIPLSRERLLERGYNQAWELTRHLATATGRPARHDILLRIETGHLQHRLSLDQRRQHAERAFAVNPEAARVLQGQKVVLIDDIMTTGTTLAAAARCLTLAGARQVQALVFARTPKPTLEPELQD